jgi:dihydroorotase
LYFNDTDLVQYDSNLKLFPPLRTKEDSQALLSALHSGVLSGLTINHYPQGLEEKEVEFEYAENGMIMLETAFSTYLNTCSQFNMPCSNEIISRIFSTGLRSIFKLNTKGIVEGQEAELTFFNMQETTQYTSKYFKSKSKNTPLFNKALKGKVLGTFVKGMWHAND